MVAPLTVSLVLQARPCDPRGGLFGLLLRMALALAVHALAHVDHREEVLRMIRALVADDVPRTPERTGRGRLLQTGLVIAPTRARGGIGDPLREAPHDEVARDGKSLIEIYRGHDGLERVREDRLFGATTRRVLALAEKQVRAEVELERQLGEPARVHDAGSHLRELAFGKLGKGLEHVVRPDQTPDPLPHQPHPPLPSALPLP